MRQIAVVATSYPSDADDVAGHFVRADVRQLLACDHHVTVFAPSAVRTDLATGERVVGIAHGSAFGSPGALVRMRYRPDRWLGATAFAFLARRKLFQHGAFDEVVAHFLLPGYWPIARGHTAMSRVVVHGSDLRLFERVPEQLRAQVVACLKQDNPTIQCASTDLAQRLDRLTHGRLGRLICVRLPPLLMPKVAPKAELRRQLSIRDEQLIVIVARLIPAKRVEVAIRAALQVPGARIVVCGGGPEGQQLAHAFPTVEFRGLLPRNQTLMWIGAADALVSASRNEGAPTAIREARALGVPVVTTAAGDLLEWAKSDPGVRVVP